MQLKITFYFLLLLKIFQCKNENKPSFGEEEEDANEASSNDKYAECSINSYETNLLSRNYLMASMLYIIKKKIIKLETIIMFKFLNKSAKS